MSCRIFVSILLTILAAAATPAAKAELKAGAAIVDIFA